MQLSEGVGSYTIRAYDELRSMITEGVWAPGERIPELEMAERLGVSRTPIRESLRSLAADGLVEAAHGKGFIVRRFSLHELNDTYRVRSFLEGEAVHDATIRMPDSQIWRLEHAVEEARRLFELPNQEDLPISVLTTAHFRFHDLILEGSKSRVLAQLVNQLMTRPLIYRAHYWYKPDERRVSIEQHQEIYEAMRLRQPDLARELMIKHTASIAATVINGVTQNPHFLAPEERDSRTLKMPPLADPEFG